MSDEDAGTGTIVGIAIQLVRMGIFATVRRVRVTVNRAGATTREIICTRV